jgi:hypothetical protein
MQLIAMKISDEYVGVYYVEDEHANFVCRLASPLNSPSYTQQLIVMQRFYECIESC